MYHKSVTKGQYSLQNASLPSKYKWDYFLNSVMAKHQSCSEFQFFDKPRILVTVHKHTRSLSPNLECGVFMSVWARSWARWGAVCQKVTQNVIKHILVLVWNFVKFGFEVLSPSTFSYFDYGRLNFKSTHSSKWEHNCVFTRRTNALNAKFNDKKLDTLD